MKNINWEKVGYWIGHIMIILILNTPLWVYLIGSFVPYGKIGEFRLSWIDYLKLSDKIEWYQIWILYIAIALGVILSILFIKGWINAMKQEQNKQALIAKQEEQTAKIIEAITKKEQKKMEKEEREIRKYLGE